METRLTDNNMTHTPEHTPVSYTNEDTPPLGTMAAEPSVPYVAVRQASPVARDMSVEELYHAIELDVKAIYAEQTL